MDVAEQLLPMQKFIRLNVHPNICLWLVLSNFCQSETYHIKCPSKYMPMCCTERLLQMEKFIRLNANPNICLCPFLSNFCQSKSEN